MGWAEHWPLSRLQGGSASSVAPGLGHSPASTLYSGLSPACPGFRTDLALLPSFWFFVWHQGSTPRHTHPAIRFSRFQPLVCSRHVEAGARGGFPPGAPLPGRGGFPLVCGAAVSILLGLPLSAHTSLCLHPCVPGTGLGAGTCREQGRPGVCLPRVIVLEAQATMNQILPQNMEKVVTSHSYMRNHSSVAGEADGVAVSLEPETELM